MQYRPPSVASCALRMPRIDAFNVHCGPTLKRECSRLKKAFQCTRTMGVSAPSLHRESTDSLIVNDMYVLLTVLYLATACFWKHSAIMHVPGRPHSGMVASLLSF